MRKIEISDSGGETVTGHLPESWAEVPLQAYADLAATAAQDLPDGVPAAHLFTSPQSREALAKLLGLPAAPLLADLRLLQPICEAAPFLFTGPLPEASGLAESFTHQGVRYTHSGLLDDATGGQLEALLTFLQAAGGNALACAPHLLAILYQPASGEPFTRQRVAATAQAFATLPMSIGFPAVLNFSSRFAPMALLSQKYSAARLAAEQALSALGQAAASPTSGPRGSSWSMRRWCIRMWIRLVHKQLRTSSPRSVFTAAPGSLPTILTIK